MALDKKAAALTLSPLLHLPYAQRGSRAETANLPVVGLITYAWPRSLHTLAPNLAAVAIKPFRLSRRSFTFLGESSAWIRYWDFSVAVGKEAMIPLRTSVYLRNHSRNDY